MFIINYVINFFYNNWNKRKKFSDTYCRDIFENSNLFNPDNRHYITEITECPFVRFLLIILAASFYFAFTTRKDFYFTLWVSLVKFSGSPSAIGDLGLVSNVGRVPLASRIAFGYWRTGTNLEKTEGSFIEFLHLIPVFYIPRISLFTLYL